MVGKTVRGDVLEPVISDDQRALIPDISGNRINGLGETARRRPTPIYWHPPRRAHPYAPLQMWMIRKSSREVPVVADMNATLGGRGNKERAPKSDSAAVDSPESWARRVKAFALGHEADLVGIAAVDPDWVYQGERVAQPWAVVLGIEMDHRELAEAPEPASVVEVMRAYNRGTRAARAVADWLLGQGYEAEPEGGPIAGKMAMIPPAIACGFGALGKHGSIINRRHGSSFRLASVLTDMPLVADPPDDIAVDDFCTRCRLCEDACPPDAITHAKQMVRGVEKWYVDFDKCVPYFNETYGCGVCIAICPWSRPGVASRLTDKIARRRDHPAAPSMGE
ncbi:MAG: 4Fe-4S dicluster domain-containing protein [Alphaproteobacteria bacterium]|nr:4Fe-4S dicluster domain-containing protein [Alphaproteobacteria bacterium]MDP6515627.1 4Fe-4S dicluster domain-containing protein [Alphaproteobacteria bacterium]